MGVLLGLGVVALVSCVREDPIRPGPGDSGVGPDTSPPGDDSGEGTSPGDDTAAGGDDTGGETGQESVWDDPAWWAEPGPLAPMLDLSKVPRNPHWEMWMITSPDLETWSEPRVIAFNFSSLDVLALEQGLIVTGSLLPLPEYGVMAPFKHVFTMVTADLEVWGSHFLEVEGTDDTPMIIDPSIHPTPEGDVQLLFFGSSLDVDPEVPPDDYPNPHAIFAATWAGDRFVKTSDEPLVSGDYVVDPTGCYWQGTHHVLGTRTYLDLFHEYREADAEAYVEGLQWDAVQVPFCFLDPSGERMGLMAQYGGGYGPPQVRWCDQETFCEDNVDLVPLEALYDGSCTSPVMAWYREQYVLFCSSWIE